MRSKHNTKEFLKTCINIGELLGCIKYKNEYHFYMTDITSYTLNYKEYDPEIESRDPNFKKGLLNITEENKSKYLEYLKDEYFSIEIIEAYIKKNGSEGLTIYFFIDFDINFYVNGYPENLSPEEYLPDDSWTAKINGPMLYLPESLRKIWK